MSFGQGAGAKWNEEQRQFLHQRVRLWAVVLPLAVYFFLFRAFGTFSSWSKLAPGAFGGIIAGCLLLLGLSLWVVTLRSPTLSRLRFSELALTLAAVVALSSWSYGWLSNGNTLAISPSRELRELLRNSFWIVSPERTTHFQAGAALISFPVFTCWCTVTGLYGVTIPNSPRRAWVVSGLLALGPSANVLAAALTSAALRPHVLSKGVVSVLHR